MKGNQKVNHVNDTIGLNSIQWDYDQEPSFQGLKSITYHHCQACYKGQRMFGSLNSHAKKIRTPFLISIFDLMLNRSLMCYKLGVLNFDRSGAQRLRYHGTGMPHEPMPRGRCHAEGRPSKLGTEDQGSIWVIIFVGIRSYVCHTYPAVN